MACSAEGDSVASSSHSSYSYLSAQPLRSACSRQWCCQSWSTSAVCRHAKIASDGRKLPMYSEMRAQRRRTPWCASSVVAHMACSAEGDSVASSSHSSCESTPMSTAPASQRRAW